MHIRSGIALVAAFFGLYLLSSCNTPLKNDDSNKVTIGSTGPGGGIVFYDKGTVSDGWQYMEVTKTDISVAIWWGGYMTDVGATNTFIGSGNANTEVIVSALTSYDTAASLCSNLVSGGKSDWFLPSKDELKMIYTNLIVPGKMGLTSDKYWSSSQYISTPSAHAYTLQFSDGYDSGWRKDLTASVRAVRYF